LSSSTQIQLTQLDKDQLARFHSLLKQRRETYGSAVVKIVLVRYPGQPEWRNSITLVHVSHKLHPSEEDQTFHYPNCIVAKRSLPLDSLVQLVEDIVTAGKMKLRNLYPVQVEGHFSPILTYDYQPSDDEIFKLAWPADSLVFEPEVKGGYPVEPFAAIDAPLFPGPYEILRVWTGVDVSRYSQFIGSIVLLLPDYSAKIEELRLTSEALTIKVQALEASLDRIAGKLYAEKLGEGTPVQRDVAFETASTTLSLGFVPDWWQFYVLSKDTKRILDYRKVHAAWSNLPAGVYIEVGSADLEEIINRGENEQVEFKRDLSHREDFLETVTAFANTEGGSILVGVDDNGTIIGTYEKKFEERVQSMVRDNCEPPPKIRIERKEVQSRAIYLVQIPEGEEKPYNLRYQGFYVRAGSTDRLASRIEMDRMYAERKSPSLGLALR
jgi:hypothetical protein